MSFRNAVMCAAISIAGIAHADPASFGAWSVDVGADGPYAATLNDSGEALMRACPLKTGVCYWVFVTTTSCENESSAPAMMNSPEGATLLTLTCGGSFVVDGKTHYRHWISQAADVDNAIRSASGYIGIAVPMKAGMFKAFRFPMQGSADALSGLSILFEKMTRQPQIPASTKSYTF